MSWFGTPNWLFAVIAAPFLGSFFSTLVIRLPSGEDVVWGRSACRSCGHALGISDLLPVISWLATGGRCRHCAAPIGWLYPGLELAALGVALWAAALTSGWLFWASCALGWTLLVLAAIDWRTFLLPDFMTLPLIPAGLAVAWLIDPPLLWSHALGAAAGLATFALIGWAYARVRGHEGLGMGDAKLLAASGAWVSWTGLPSVIFLGGAAALLVALAGRLLGADLSPRQKIPFGSYLALATWFVWLHGPLAIG